MSCSNKDTSALRQVVRCLATLLLVVPAAYAVDSGDIIVVSSKGEVHITSNGAERNVSAGGVLELPASVRTGRDGSVELKQGATTVSVGPETLLEFPALEKRGAPIDRIVQPSGNAFYNIGKREGRKLRVETPYLVGVIKGTQFNVAIQDGATTISLFEGLLEVRAGDDGDVVDLKAGEIASRKRGDDSISVIKMDAGKAPAGRPPTGRRSNNGTLIPADAGAEPSSEASESALVDDVGPKAVVGLGSSVDVAVNPSVNDGASGTDVATAVGLDSGLATADLGVSTVVEVATGVDVTTPVVDVGLGAAAVVDVPSVAVDLDVDVGGVDIDLGVDLAVDDGNNGHGNDNGRDPSNPGNSSDNKGHGNLGELVDDLLRRPGKK